MRRTRDLVIVSLVAAALWFAAGELYGWVTYFGVLPTGFAALLLPPTTPTWVWNSVAPFNVLLPALATLAFAGVYALLLPLARRGFLATWFVGVASSFLIAAVLAAGQLVAMWPPLRLAFALDGVRDQLLAGGYWGLAWGWIPALIVVLLGRRTSDVAADAAPVAATRAAALVAALVLLVAGVGVVTSAPLAESANRASSTELPPLADDPIPVYTPPPPALVAPGDFDIDQAWCRADQLSIADGGGDAATGHRLQSLLATNVSDESCVLDGYADLAFANDLSGDLGVSVFHGGSFMTTDAGAAPITLAPGATAIAQLGWNANSTAGGGETNAVYAAAYAGAERTPVAVTLDVTAGSTVALTAWELRE